MANAVQTYSLVFYIFNPSRHRSRLSSRMASDMNPHRDETVKKIKVVLLSHMADLPTTVAEAVSEKVYEEVFGVIPEYDNHHNALICPYCNRRRDEEERKIRTETLNKAADDLPDLNMLLPYVSEVVQWLRERAAKE